MKPAIKLIILLSICTCRIARMPCKWIMLFVPGPVFSAQKLLQGKDNEESAQHDNLRVRRHGQHGNLLQPAAPSIAPKANYRQLQQQAPQLTEWRARGAIYRLFRR